MNETNQAVRNAVILIPSLEPDERLPAYIRELEQSGFGLIVVVDDGSGEDYQPIFREVAEIPELRDFAAACPIVDKPSFGSTLLRTMLK